MSEKSREYSGAERRNIGNNQEGKIQTYPRITWKEFLEIAEEYNLKCAFKGTFEGKNNKSTGTVCYEEEVILFDPKTGIVVFAETINERFLGEAIISGEISGTFAKLNFNQKSFFSRVTMMKKGVKGIGFSFHIKRGFEESIDTLKKLFEFVPVWDTNVAPNCLNYMERGKHIEGRNEQKLKECLTELREIIQYQL